MNSGIYRLPFDTNVHPIVVTQGYFGEYSHHRFGIHDYSYAVDFGLPFGTDVLAARDGMIWIASVSRLPSYRGLDRSKADLSATQVVVKHEDGTYANYQHLDGEHLQALNFERGARIYQGQCIGRTGDSGWLGPHPHLHFMAYRIVRDEKRNTRITQSFPVFEDGPWSMLKK